MTAPWQTRPPLGADLFAEVREQTIFDCCKWDPQVGDISTLTDFPLVLDANAWETLAGLAENLARETLAAEAELAQRPELHRDLAIPRPIRRALRRSTTRPPGTRVMRFDFHFTRDGWQVSETNSDVPGGFIEAGGFTRLMRAQYPDCLTCGDPAEKLAEAMCATLEPGSTVAMVHATAYSDDRQVMAYIGRALAARGVRAVPFAPDGVDWQDRDMRAVVRFFPAEWLPGLPRVSRWENFFGANGTRLCNPATALLTQSKRFPLLWDQLSTALPTWRALLPETRDPRAVRWRQDDEWVLKPALGRMGEGIGMVGVTPEKSMRSIRRDATWHPRHWVAQRRFQPIPLTMNATDYFPCVGVFTIDHQAVGVYGRIGRGPLVDHQAQDIAVLRAA